MRLVILARSPRLEGVVRLREAAREAGHAVQVVEPHRSTVFLAVGPAGRPRPRVSFRGKPLRTPDAALVRPRTPPGAWEVSVARAFEASGVPVVAPSDALARLCDPLGWRLELARAGIAQRPWAWGRGREGALAAARALGGPPLELSLAGEAWTPAEGPAVLEGLLAAVGATTPAVAVRGTFAGSGGDSPPEVSVTVVGGRVLAPEGLPPAWSAVALRTARVLGLLVAAVGLRDAPGGPLVESVGACPHLGVLPAPGTAGPDLARTVIDYVADRALERVPS
ncbi:MAG: hypothetical protein HY722_14455 [Planctomycetes bacterium]|nr:hypothetical protein [Planctomycetota bacterium]